MLLLHYIRNNYDIKMMPHCNMMLKYNLMIHIVVNNAPYFETEVLEKGGTNMNGVRCPRKFK
jgi:hypothetical protein